MGIWGNTLEECAEFFRRPSAPPAPGDERLFVAPEMLAIFDDAGARAHEQRAIAKINQKLNEILMEDLAKLAMPPLDLSENTKAAYKTTLARFKAWCEEMGITYFPAAPESVAAFIIDECHDDGVLVLPALAKRHVSAIRFRHVIAGIQSPTDSQLVTAALSFIKRKAKEEA